MSVRKAAGLEPSGLIAPSLGEKVSKAEVDVAKRPPTSMPVVEPNFFVMPQMSSRVADLIWGTFFGPSDVPVFTPTGWLNTANDDQQLAPRPMTSDQIGKFIVNRAEASSVELLSTILDGVIVLSAIPMMYVDATEYIGLHKDFPPTSDDADIPTFTPIVSNGKRIWLPSE